MGRTKKEVVPEHMKASNECLFVCWEQGDKHRANSRANAGKGTGCVEGTAGSHWQSHHILCIAAFKADYRKSKNDETNGLLDECLWQTDWNINDAPNMIGLPQRALYRMRYKELAVDGPTTVSPQDLPAHNNDHIGVNGYLWEVSLRLRRNVWNKFNGSEPDHKKNAQWLDAQLRTESEDVLFILKRRGRRNGGTVAGWRNRFEDSHRLTWYRPFSMGVCPTPRLAGVDWNNLRKIFRQLKL